MKRFLSAFLAVFIFLSCFSLSAFAADSGELVCPDCGSSLVDSSVDVGIFVSHHYKCTNCDYERSFMDLFGWNIGQSGSLSDPVYKDGNITYTVPGNGVPGQPTLRSVKCDFISPNGFPAWYYKPILKTDDSSYRVTDTHFIYDGFNESSIYFANSKAVDWSLSVPLAGTFRTYGQGFSSSSDVRFVDSAYNTFTRVLWYSSGIRNGSDSFTPGNILPGEFQFTASRAYSPSDMLYVGSSNSHGADLENTGIRAVIANSSLRYHTFSFTFVLELVGDKYGNPYDFSVKDNDHINTTDNSITVNGNVITYNTAYYDNGVYYIYTDNGVTTYYTDNSGNIYGDVTYQGDTYYITIYNQPEPTPSPSPSPTPDPDNPDNPPTPTPDPDNPTPTPKPTPGGDGSDDSGSSGPSWWDKLVDSIFGAISDFFEGVVKAALKGLWKLLSAILKLPFFIGELFTKLFPFVPGEIATFCVGGFGVLLIVIIKFIRG